VSSTAIETRANAAADSDPGGALAAHRKKNNDKLTIGGFFAVAEQGDAEAGRILDETAQQFAVGILTAVNVCDPEAVVIGGGAADADASYGSHWITAIAGHVHRRAFSDAGRNLRVGRAVLGNDAGFVGAAALAAHKLLESD
jgi:glucokinase